MRPDGLVSTFIALGVSRDENRLVMHTQFREIVHGIPPRSTKRKREASGKCELLAEHGSKLSR